MKKAFLILFIFLLSAGFLVGCSVNAKNSNKMGTNFENTIKPNTENQKTDSGRYVGLADNNFFEVSGVPEEKAAKVFMLTDKVRDKFYSLELESGKVIKINYYTNEHGQNILLDIDRY